MAEHDQDQKTEEATPRQKEQFRKKGDVFRSQDVASVAALAAGIGALVMGWTLIGTNISNLTRLILGNMDMHDNKWHLVLEAGKVVLIAVTPVAMSVLLIGLMAQIAMVGFNFSFEPMEFKPEKFNPFPKLKSMFFSTDSIIEIVKSLIKIGVIGTLATRVLWDEVANNGRLLTLSPIEVLQKIGTMGIRIVLMVILALAFITIFDVLVERWRHSKKMRMTKEEVKQEHKDMEGDPQVKGRIRGKQREMAMTRMMGEVKQADVVVVNPTHYSVALKYDMARHAAPVILASGVDNVAARIRKQARQSGVPVVSDPPLARALFNDGHPGKPIPRELFSAVASLLAWVYNVTGKM